MKKYWVAISERSDFSKDDKTLFVVFPDGQKSNFCTPLMSAYIEAGSSEDARKALHAFIDGKIDHDLHIVKMESAIQGKKDELSKAMSGDRIPDNEVDSLSIGAPVNFKNKTSSNLLSTEDILGPDKAV